jgi:20S proteasome subunit beta 2
MICSQRQEALDLVIAAISAGIFNDLGSGSNVDACIITADRTEMLRNVEMPNQRVKKERDYKFRRGTTAWTKEDVRKLIVEEEITTSVRSGSTGDEMDTS